MALGGKLKSEISGNALTLSILVYSVNIAGIPGILNTEEILKIIEIEKHLV